MRIAIIGTGGMGGGVGRLARAGHEVVFSGSRRPEKLAHAAESAGPTARVAADAAGRPTSSLSACRSSGTPTLPDKPGRHFETRS